MNFPKVIKRAGITAAPNLTVVTDPEDLEQHREAGRRLVLDLVNELVTDPTSIQVNMEVGERTTVYRVDCAKSCIGQILGAKGKNINAVRTLIASITARKGFRAVVEIPFYPDN